MARKKGTGPTEKHVTVLAADAPNPGIRRSKRLQDQSSKAKATSSTVDSSGIHPRVLPSNGAKKGSKTKKASIAVSKRPSRPVKKGPKDEASKDNPGPNLRDKKLALKDGQDAQISIESKVSFKPTSNKPQSNAVSERATSTHSSTNSTKDKRGSAGYSHKRRLDKEKVQDTSSNEPRMKSAKLGPNSYTQSGNVRTFGTLQKLASTGCQIPEDLSKDICCTDTVNNSRLPSPLADLGNQQRRFLHFVNNHVPDQIRLLFHEIRNDSAYYRRTITRRFTKEAQGVFVEYLSGTRPAPARSSDQRDEDDDSDDNVDTAMHSWPSDTPKFESALGPRDEEDKILPGSTGLQVWAFENPEISQRSHFVVSDYDHLAINESVFGQDLIAGPLPKFAIIQIDQYTLFWWRTLEALDYIPHRDTLSLTQQEQEIGKKKQVTPHNGAWPDILNQGFARHRMQRQHSGQRKEGKQPHRLDRYRDLEIDSVLLAIASIWDGLRKRGVYYAFAGLDVLEPDIARFGEFSGSGVVGGSRKFIMPLSLPPNPSAQKAALEHWKRNKDKNSKSKAAAAWPAVGHIVLAVAEKLSDAGNGVSISTLDSRIGTFPDSIIDWRAALLATKSGWLGHRRFGHPRMRVENWPEDERPQCQRQLVPQQPAGSNACGLFTILNAWAVMLDIPLRNNCRRGGRRSDREFLELGQEIVNLALAGFMDSRTIQAFLNVFGLSEWQDASNSEDDNIGIVDAVWMNHEKFLRILDMQKHRDADFPVPSLSPDSEGGMGQEAQFSENDIRLLIIAGGLTTTREQVLRALRQTDGNIETAAAIIQAEKYTPEPPSNE